MSVANSCSSIDAFFRLGTNLTKVVSFPSVTTTVSLSNTPDDDDEVLGGMNADLSSLVAKVVGELMAQADPKALFPWEVASLLLLLLLLPK